MDHGSGTSWLDSGHPLLAGLHAATTDMATAAGAGRDRVTLLSDADTRAALDAVMAIQAMSTALLASLLCHAEVQGLRAQLNARTTSSWFAHTARISGPAAREHVKLAELLDASPEAADLLAAGAATVAHARIVADTITHIDKLGTVDADTRAAAVAFLTTHARQLDPPALQVAARALVEALTTTPDTDDPDEEAAVEREAAEKPVDRFIQITRDRDGTSSGRWKGLDADATAAIETYLHHATLDHEDSDTDAREASAWESAPDKSGSDENEIDDPCRDRRTKAQRRPGAVPPAGPAHQSAAAAGRVRPAGPPRPRL